MWIRISKIDLKQVDTTGLNNPVHAGSPMELTFYQQESRMAFFVSIHKKVLAEYRETASGALIPKRKWTPEMERFAREELSKFPPQKGLFKLTVIGWLFFLLAFGLLGYLIYDGLQAPARQEAYEKEIAEKATVEAGDIYFGRYRIYKEKGSVLGSEGGFGWFKVLRIENGNYYITKSAEISQTARPKEQMNSTDFEPEGTPVQAKELDAYTKHFVSEDGLTEFNLNEKKE